jgi:UDP-N-acetylmuramoyl-L-alanyl-D-glutamate--2,6-diaminopimelate ligase
VPLVDSRSGMNLERLIAALAPTAVVDGAPSDVRDLAYDARSVGAGSLFFCVRGARADGHDFAAEAVSRGAVALVVERELPLPVTQIVVRDSRAAMAPAADLFFGEPTRTLVVAGVTGTNGKTTTAFLLHSILDAAELRPGLLGTVESRVGGATVPVVHTTPEAIDLQRTFKAMLDAGDRSCAMEASSHAAALHRLDSVRFAALAFTNLTQDHLDFHGTMEDYYAAKRSLFAAGRPPAAVNIDDPFGRRLVDELRGRQEVVTFGFGSSGEIRPEDLELTPSGARLRVGRIELRTHLRGRFNVSNILAAVTVARLLEVEADAIAAGVERLTGVPGRFEPVDEGQAFPVLVDYAHTPDSLENVLRTARELARNRLICVFGCGGDRDRDKRPLMGAIAARLADRAILTSDNPRSEEPLAIIAEVLAGAPELEVEPDRRSAIERAIEAAGEGDAVVVAGKGHEQGQQFADELLPFDDREVARETLRRLRAPA